MKGIFGDVEFQFNPKELELAIANRWKKHEVLGVEVDRLFYTGGSGWKGPLTLFFTDFDSLTGRVEDTIETLRTYARKDPASNAPKAYLFTYGRRTFFAIIHELKIVSILKYGSNLDDRIATVTAEIEEYVEEEYHRTPETEKGDRYVTVAGQETFRTIALSEYKNVELWACLADYNRKITLDSDGPILPEGSEILIPSWEIAKEYLPANTAGGLISYE